MNTRLNHVKDWLELAKQADWSATKLAKLCGVSVRTLERSFIKIFGKAPKAWMAEQRQKRALEYLRGGYSIKETASKLGYRQSHHFSRDFKKQWNHCPTLLNSTPASCRVLV